MTTWTTLADHRPDAGLGEPDAQLILAVVFEQPAAPGTPATSGGRFAAVAVAGAASASVFLLTRADGTPADFLTYRYAAALAARGVDVYAANVTGPGLHGQPFTYTPVATVALWPTTALPAHAGYVGWTVVTLAVLAAALSMGTAATLRGTAVLTVAVIAAANTDLIGDHLQVGQINVLLMGLCLLDLTRSDRSRLGRVCPPGVLIGVAAAIKLTPALFIVHFAVTRQWRLARFATLGCVAATGLGAFARPDLTVTFARSVLWTLSDRVDLAHPPSYAGNQSITGVLAAAGLDGGAATVLVVLAAGTGVLAAARYVHAAGRRLDAGLIVGMSAPLLAPFSWNHHHVFVLPALALLARRSWPSQPFAAAGVVGILALLYFAPSTGDALLRDGPWWAAPAGAVLRENAMLAAMLVGTALVFGARRAARR